MILDFNVGDKKSLWVRSHSSHIVIFMRPVSNTTDNGEIKGPHTLLGIKSGTGTVRHTVWWFLKKNHRVITWPSKSTSRYILNELKAGSPTNACTDVHYSTLYDSQDVGTATTSMDERMDKLWYICIIENILGLWVRTDFERNCDASSNFPCSPSPQFSVLSDNMY